MQLRKTLAQQLQQHSRAPAEEPWSYERNKKDTETLLRRLVLIHNSTTCICAREHHVPPHESEQHSDACMLSRHSQNPAADCKEVLGALRDTGAEHFAVQKEGGFGDLPSEIMQAVLSRLGPDDLARCARVCWAWRLAVLDPSHWRRVCLRTWPRQTQSSMLTLLADRGSPYRSWRAMFLLRPRLRFDGVYCLRHQYVRVAGENHHRAVALVYYYRMLRFYEDGAAVSFTTAGKPEHALLALRRKWDGDKSRMPAIGSATLHESELSVSTQVPLYHPEYPLMRRGTTCMDLGLDETHAGARNRLWPRVHYSVIDGSDEPTFYDVPERPFRFVPFAGFVEAFNYMFPDERKHFLRRKREVDELKAQEQRSQQQQQHVPRSVTASVSRQTRRRPGIQL